MIAVDVAFAAGCYRAAARPGLSCTAGQEWPPSPYRLVRALIAAWKFSCPGMGESEALPALRLLCGEPPSLLLPEARPGSGGGARFLRVDASAPVRLFWGSARPRRSEAERLAALLRNLRYFGGTGSWCDASLASGLPPGADRAANCRPRRPSRGEGAALVLVPEEGADPGRMYRDMEPGGGALPPGSAAVPYDADAGALPPGSGIAPRAGAR